MENICPINIPIIEIKVNDSRNTQSISRFWTSPVKPIRDFNEIIAKEVAMAAFILKSDRITRIGIIINPPPAPTSPVKKPIKEPSVKIKNLLGAIVLVCFNPTIVLGVFFYHQETCDKH